jgi:hypothetical protein
MTEQVTAQLHSLLESDSCSLGRQGRLHSIHCPNTCTAVWSQAHLASHKVRCHQSQATGSSGSQSCWWPSTIAHLPAHPEALAPSLLPPAALQDVQRPLTSPHLQVSHSVMVV